MNSEKVLFFMLGHARNIKRTFLKISVVSLSLVIFSSAISSEAKEKITFSCSVSSKLPMFKAAEESFRKAFAALGYDFELVEAANGKRGLIDVITGVYDGDCARAGDLNEWIPNSHLVRLDIKLSTSFLGAWTADPTLSIDSVNDLKARHLRLGNLKGILASDNFFAENKLVATLEANNLSTAIKLMRANRLDVFVAPVEGMKQRLAQDTADNTKTGASDIRLVFNLKAYDIYPYIHEKHKALGAQLEVQLKKLATNKESNP